MPRYCASGLPTSTAIPTRLWNQPLEELKELWDFHAGLGSLCELIASVQFGHEEFFPRTSKSFIERVGAHRSDHRGDLS